MYHSLLVSSILFVFRTFMEWKYEKSSKQYMRSMVSSSFLLILFFIMMILSLPKDIAYTHNAFMYSDDGTIGASIEIEILGQLKPNILYRDFFEGQLNINEKEFYLSNYGETETPFFDRFRSKNRFYTMIELTGYERGELWISKDFDTFVGRVDGFKLESGETTIKFASSAETLEKAKELFNQMSQN